MKVLDLFSGIGGFSLGLERAGMTTIAFCEKDEFCQQVLKKHWPEIPIYNDIKELDGKQFRGTVDLVCGGFPCQPFSAAGARKGKDDDRDLWPEMLRIVREVKPRWVIGENVAGFISMEFERTANGLEAAGYEVQAFVIPACAVGAPHRRDRLWILAHSEHHGPSTLPQRGGNVENVRERPEGQKITEQPPGIYQPGNVADSDSQRQQQPEGQLAESGRRPSDGSKTLADSTGAIGEVTLAGQAGQGGRGFTNGGGWAIEPDVGRVVNGVSALMDCISGIPIADAPRCENPKKQKAIRAHRIKALGNAVVPQIPEILGRIILSDEWANNAVIGELNPYI